MRAVSNMTGVNPNTLRAWERRYRLLRPERSEGGHRLYSADDVARIRRIVDWLGQGVSPAQAGVLLRDADRALETSGAEADWKRRRERVVEAIERFDEATVDDLYRTTLATCPLAEVTESLTVPVLEMLGERWESGAGLVSEEHFFLLYLRNRLGARFFHRSRGQTGKTLLAACVPGERHDIGLLLFVLAAEAEGYRVISLGADAPLSELPRVASTCGAAAIVLSAVWHDERADWPAELRSFTTLPALPVFVGGHESARRQRAIEGAGAIVLGGDLRPGLQRLRQSLRRS